MQDSKWASIAVLCLCQVAVMGLWFSASAVIPSLTAEYGLSGFIPKVVGPEHWQAAAPWLWHEPMIT